MKIPKSFKLFATEIKVEFDNVRMNNQDTYGICDYTQSKILLASTVGIDKVSECQIKNTFYHEKVHAILNAMQEHKLNSNEKFVELFSKLLRQSDETAEY
jgi:hypothetical protein